MGRSSIEQVKKRSAALFDVLPLFCGEPDRADEPTLDEPVVGQLRAAKARAPEVAAQEPGAAEVGIREVAAAASANKKSVIYKGLGC